MVFYRRDFIWPISTKSGRDSDVRLTGDECYSTACRCLWMVPDTSKLCGLSVAGSYVTAKTDPRDVDVVIWVGERFLELLELGDKQALDLELMFLTREPKGENGGWRGDEGAGVHWV